MRPRLLLLAVTAACLGLPSSAAAATPLLSTTVDPAERGGPRTPSSFLGVSAEFDTVLGLTGAEPYGPNVPFERLFGRLAEFGGGRPVLRIGGGTTDSSWWNPNGAKKPGGISINISPYLTDNVAAFATRTQTPLIVGLNLATTDPEITATWAREAQARLPGIETFELGNESERFNTRPVGRNPDGSTLHARPDDWDIGPYLKDMTSRIARLRADNPAIPISAPGSLPIWAPNAGAVVRSLKGLEGVGYHSYAMTRCGVKPGDEHFPTAARLLDDDRLIPMAFRWQQVAKIARASGKKFRLTESNSVSCGGMPGVSDAFAATVWGAEWLFLMLNFGVDQIAMHSSSPYYSPLYPQPTDGTYAMVAGPLYYGMLAFARATANRARLLPKATQRAKAAKGANIRPWATVDADGTVRVLVTAKSNRLAGDVALRIRGARGPATLERVTAPSLASQKGIRFAGQRIATPTKDGELLGTRRTSTVRKRNGQYRFRVRGAQLALLTVPTRR